MSELSEYGQWFKDHYDKTPMERHHLPEFSRIVYDRQQEKIDKLLKQSKCQHTWHGKSENQYCCKCGLHG